MNGSDADTTEAAERRTRAPTGNRVLERGVLKHRYPTVRASTPLARSPTSANPSSNRPWRRRPRRRRLRPMRRSKGRPRDARDGPRVSSVLVAVGPGPHSGRPSTWRGRLRTRPTRGSNSSTSSPRTPRLRTGRRGDRSDAENDIETTESGDGERDDYATAGERLLDAARDRLGGFDRVDRWLVEDRSAAGAIVEQSPTTPRRRPPGHRRPIRVRLHDRHRGRRRRGSRGRRRGDGSTALNAE